MSVVVAFIDPLHRIGEYFGGAGPFRRFFVGDILPDGTVQVDHKNHFWVVSLCFIHGSALFWLKELFQGN